MLRKWDELPRYMRTDAVCPYYENLKKKCLSLFLKRLFDIVMSLILLILLSPFLLGISVLIAVDSKGGILFRQERITQYGRKFKIHKFRTMVANAENIGSLVTISNDARITKLGSKLRKYRLDELPQLIDILSGDMSFVGTRPEVPKYVKMYTPEMMATLLMPAGVTSEASIKYKDEDRILKNAKNVDEVYVNEVLPGKMEYNLKSIRRFSFLRDLGTMVRTVYAVLRKDEAKSEDANVDGVPFGF